MKLITALATPFLHGKIHLESFVKLLESQICADGVLCAGTTGEGAALCACEKKLLLNACKAVLPDKQIWLGVSSSVTAVAQVEAEFAAKNGVYGVLVTPPSFSKCTKEGFVRHVQLIKEACDLPIMLYNAPSRCGYVLWEDAVKQLAQEGIEYLKDAGSDIGYAENCEKHIKLLCGNEEKLPEFCKTDMYGVVSVVSNVAPHLTADVLHSLHCDGENAVKNGEFTAKTEDEPCRCNSNAEYTCKKETCLEKSLHSLCPTSESCREQEVFATVASLCFREINPLPIKYLLYKTGVFDNFEMRLPLTKASQNLQKDADEFLRQFSPFLR